MNKLKTRSTIVTMSDVAKQAGVSQSTASFVLNDRQVDMRISEGTRQRVLGAAQELGYQRNELARAVGSGKNFVLGFAKEDHIGELEWRILDGVLKTATDAGYLLKVLSHDRTDEGYRTLARHCVQHRLAGLITRSHITADGTEVLRMDLKAAGVPIVLVDDILDLPETTCVASDDKLGCRLAVEHLTGLGHRDIAILAGDSIHPQSIFRTNWYLNFLGDHGISVRPEWIQVCNWDIVRVEAQTRALFKGSGGGPTAIICGGDVLAAGVLRVLYELGLRVPQDVSVIGYSDFTFSKLLCPPLTTIAQPYEEIGSAATQRMLGLLQNKGRIDSNPWQMLLPTKLVVRGSTGPVRTN